MTTRRWAFAAGMAVTAAGLSAQSGGGFGGGGRGAGGVLEFQQASTMNSMTPRTTSGRSTGSGPLAVTSRPFSATEERKSLQKLGDGTEISSTETNLLSRDSQGRTRVEQTCQSKTVIGILDPVAMVYLDINPATRTVTKTPIPEGTTSGGISVAGCLISRSFGRGSAGGGTYIISGQAMSAGEVGTVSVPRTALPPAVAVAIAGARGGGAGGGTVAATGGGGGRVAPGVPIPTAATNAAKDELGVQSTNGVLAVGKRSTVTIPQGQIGNNRDMHVINERWYSEDLGMTVKTLNSDPRFGDNIYEMTGITRSEPDAALFQVPAGYTVVESVSGGVFRPVMK